jgi:two-component system sensor histidine kinase ChvG
MPDGSDLRFATDAAAARRARRGFSLSPSRSLLRRILFFNAIGLGLLVGGVLYLNQFRQGLIELRSEALRTQGEIIAIAVAEAAGEPGPLLGLNPVRANLVLRRLAQPAGVRARLYDRRGRLTGDTRSFDDGGSTIDTAPLPPVGAEPRKPWLARLEGWYGDLVALFQGRPELYRETPVAGIARDAEIYAALDGRSTTAVRANSDGELIVSVAIPVLRFKAVMGVLVVSTEGGDIDAIVQAERIAILRVALVATLVSAALSLLLASTIARPLRRLAEAAIRSGAIESGGAGRRAVDPRQVQFPDFTSRADEIGLLSGALRHMTGALYGRIEAIERFAADVAHEIKNPLTSLRSAVETLRRTPAAELRERLMAVIEHDVRRLDRLVTDISNASRLDAELAREAMESVDVDALLQTIADIAAARAEKMGARVVAAPATEPLRVRGLEGRLGQVFLNLADNAVSFSPPGGEVRLSARLAAGGKVEIRVEDDGPGMPEENLERIFERFYSARPESEGFGDHSGLGLSISRQIVEAHGGRIWAENRRAPGEGADAPPRGARFTVLLPADG